MKHGDFTVHAAAYCALCSTSHAINDPDCDGLRQPVPLGFMKMRVVPSALGHQEYTGGSVSYYKVEIAAPTSGGDAYTAECNDIIEALGMNYAEGNVFKAVWRRCAARQGRGKAGYKDGLYDAEKVVFFGERMVVQEKANG
jgi:hypothetical protein